MLGLKVIWRVRGDVLADLHEGLPGVLDKDAETFWAHHQMLREGHTLLSLRLIGGFEDYHNSNAVLNLLPEIQFDDDATTVRFSPNETRFNEIILNINTE